MFCELERVVE